MKSMDELLDKFTISFGDCIGPLGDAYICQRKDVAVLCHEIYSLRQRLAEAEAKVLIDDKAKEGK